MLEELIEHDPELRDVLSRRRLFKELISSTAGPASGNAGFVSRRGALKR